MDEMKAGSAPSAIRLTSSPTQRSGRVAYGKALSSKVTLQLSDVTSMACRHFPASYIGAASIRYVAFGTNAYLVRKNRVM